MNKSRSPKPNKIVRSALIVTAIAISVAHAETRSEKPAPPFQPPAQRTGPDSLISKAWHLSFIGAFEAWKISEGNGNTLLALIDSGVNYNHPDIAPRIRIKRAEFPFDGVDNDRNGFIDDALGWDFSNNRPLPFDRSEHGTYLAGVAVAERGNGTGSAGVCPRCGLLPVRFIDENGMGDTDDAIAGIYYAVHEKASVINLSFAGEGADKTLKDAILYAARNDVLVVTAAGNDDVNLDRDSVYPAKFQLPNLITVAATDDADELTYYSNWSKRYVHLAAPGDSILGPWKNEWADDGGGTSVAAAIVSAAATLVRSAAPRLSAVDTKAVLLGSIRRTPKLKDKVITSGALDLAAAVRCAVDPKLSCLRPQRR